MKMTIDMSAEDRHQMHHCLMINACIDTRYIENKTEHILIPSITSATFSDHNENINT